MLLIALPLAYLFLHSLSTTHLPYLIISSNDRYESYLTVKSEKTVHFFLSIAPFLPFASLITATHTQQTVPLFSAVTALFDSALAGHADGQLVLASLASAPASSPLEDAFLAPSPTIFSSAPPGSTFSSLPGGHLAAGDCTEICDGHHCRTMGTGQRSVLCPENRSR